MPNRQVGYIATDELNWELGIDWGIYGRHWRYKCTWIISGRACVGCGWAGIRRGWLDAIERLLTLWDVSCDCERVENEWKNDEGERLPLSRHCRGVRCMGVEEEERLGSCSTKINMEFFRVWVPSPTVGRAPSPYKQTASAEESKRLRIAGEQVHSVSKLPVPVTGCCNRKLRSQR